MANKHHNQYTEAWISAPSQYSTRSHEIHSNITMRLLDATQRRTDQKLSGRKPRKVSKQDRWHVPAKPSKHTKTNLAEFGCYIITKTTYWEMIIIMTENVKISNRDRLCKFPYKASRFLTSAKPDCCSIGKISSYILKDYCQAKLLPYPNWNFIFQVSLSCVTWNAFVMSYSKDILKPGDC